MYLLKTALKNTHSFIDFNENILKDLKILYIGVFVKLLENRGKSQIFVGLGVFHQNWLVLVNKAVLIYGIGCIKKGIIFFLFGDKLVLWTFKLYKLFFGIYSFLMGRLVVGVRLFMVFIFGGKNWFEGILSREIITA